MANKIDTVMDAIAGALEALVTAKTFRAFHRNVVNPQEASQVPCVYLMLNTFRRQGDIWDAEALIGIICRSDGSASDSDITELCGEVDNAVTALQDGSGTVGGNIDQPTFDVWYHMPQNGAKVGAVATIHFTVAAPLKTPALTPAGGDIESSAARMFFAGGDRSDSWNYVWNLATGGVSTSLSLLINTDQYIAGGKDIYRYGVRFDTRHVPANTTSFKLVLKRVTHGAPYGAVGIRKCTLADDIAAPANYAAARSGTAAGEITLTTAGMEYELDLLNVIAREASYDVSIQSKPDYDGFTAPADGAYAILLAEGYPKLRWAVE